MPKFKLQCVVVLYKVKPTDTPAIRSLRDLSVQQRDLAEQINLLIYDNSPQAQAFDPGWLMLGSVHYYHASLNGGLSPAYNRALSMAKEEGTGWLLLLDQDTILDAIFISSLLGLIETVPRTDVCAIVPKLFQDGHLLSPQVVRRFNNQSIAAKFSGLAEGVLTAYNSGACLRVAALVESGGFATDYWLDYLDHVTFFRLQAAGGRVWILDVAMEQKLSLNSLGTEMDLARYINLLSAEWKYVRETGSGGGSLIHRIRLIKRAISQIVRQQRMLFAFKTARAAFAGN
jgi:GT2 family glycosyltransferase